MFTKAARNIINTVYNIDLTDLKSGKALKGVYKMLYSWSLRGPPAPWAPGQGVALDPPGALRPPGPQLGFFSILKNLNFHPCNILNLTPINIKLFNQN